MNHAISFSGTPASPMGSDSTRGGSAPTVESRGGHRRGWPGWCGIIGTVALALFWGMFSLDEPLFSLGWLMHNLPAMVIAVGAWLAWRRPGFGALWLFVAAAGTLPLFRPWLRLDTLLITTVPLVILSNLLAMESLRNRRGM